MRGLSRFLAAMRGRRWWGWCGLILYAIAVTFPHQPVQDLLSKFTDRFGREPLYHGSVTIALAIGVVLTLMLLAAVWKRRDGKWLAALWFLSLALMVAVWRVFMANNTELVHFPQYFPEGVALMALTLSPVEAMAWLAVFGWLDEGYQFIWLTHGRATLLDFNDIYMDLIGGAAGIIFAMALLTWEKRREVTFAEFAQGIFRRPGVRAIGGILAVGAVLLASGKLLVYELPGGPAHWFALSRLQPQPFWYFSPIVLGPHHFHEMMPPEGTLLILLTIPIFAPLERKIVFVPKPAIDR